MIRKMRKLEKTISLFLVYVLLSVIISACATGKGTAADSSTGSPPLVSVGGAEGKYTFRYFPASSVYFDIQRGVYFYKSNGKWKKSYQLPSSIKINLLKDYVVLKMDVEKPYQHHEEVIRRYPPKFMFGSKKKLR
jgi:predicted small secreted protein